MPLLPFVLRMVGVFGPSILLCLVALLGIVLPREMVWVVLFGGMTTAGAFALAANFLERWR